MTDFVCKRYVMAVKLHSTEDSFLRILFLGMLFQILVRSKAGLSFEVTLKGIGRGEACFFG